MRWVGAEREGSCGTLWHRGCPVHIKNHHAPGGHVRENDSREGWHRTHKAYGSAATTAFPGEKVSWKSFLYVEGEEEKEEICTADTPLHFAVSVNGGRSGVEWSDKEIRKKLLYTTHTHKMFENILSTSVSPFPRRHDKRLGVT